MPEFDGFGDQLRQEFLRQTPDFDLGSSLPSKVSALVRRHHRQRLIATVSLMAAVIAAVAIPLVSLHSSPAPKNLYPATGSTSTSQTPEPTTTGPATTTMPPSLPASSPGLQSGLYLDGTQGSPHYFVSLTAESNGRLIGAVEFLYQDGQTSVVINFSGTWQGGVATLHPESIPQNGSASQEPSTVPSAISMPYSRTGIELGECTQYLHFAEGESQCEFSYSANGNLNG
jgi:hypothetical protein